MQSFGEFDLLNISIRMAAIKDGGIKMSLQGKKVLVVGT